jgi:4a-hydroxytetrahydrobiopterin dehydratase
MSEKGWQGFLAAEGVADWVLLHGGATAVFRVASLVEAARLAQAVAQVSGLDGALITLTDGQLTVRLTRGVFRLEERHVELAQAISAVAREHGAVADRTLAQEVQLAIAAQPDAIDVGFWRAVLGYAELADDNAVDPLGHGSTVWMQNLDPTKPLLHAMHIDVSVAREQAEQRLAAALTAGGRIIDDSDAPNFWILADRAGNRVCIAAWPDGAIRHTQNP